MGGGRTAVFLMWCFSVTTVGISFSSSTVLSWNDKSEDRDGVLIWVWVWVNIASLSSSMVMAFVEKPWSASRRVVWPGNGRPMWS